MQYDIVRAWKDEEYNQSMPQQAENPVGYAELSDADLELMSGCGEGAPGKSIVQGEKADNEVINNFSFKKKTNAGLIIIDLTLVDLSCAMFNNVYF
ncbi:mersacidin/lichenicidin family type 2 lantibiotic [Ktedonospora formicarum]|uniref:Mersacidin/lichenicidin family type 2 lantibiotic n=1 Tax=Ktedonospora formicarum TaxID=2778364 RepID=A0A8J3I638_9CHLR|nr:mersacidin/lichenicidin family type 2 lantibiotic [Ktedonospora formicarum]GHO45399.1 hypothetical protein KSX_35620 [Ktedonospora formicarum]